MTAVLARTVVFASLQVTDTSASVWRAILAITVKMVGVSCAEFYLTFEIKMIITSNVCHCRHHAEE